MPKIWISGLAMTVVLGGAGWVWADAPEAVSLEQAIGCLQAAVAARPGAVKELDVKREGSRLVCAVEILNGREEFEVEVDAGTRQILRVKRD